MTAPTRDSVSRTIPNPTDEPTLSVKRVAAILDLGTSNVYDAINKGEIHAIRVGRRLIIPTARFLAQFKLTDDA